MLKQRVLTAAVLIPLALGVIFYLPLEWFAYATLVVLVLAAWEWSPLMGVHRQVGRMIYAVVVAAIIGCLIYLVPAGEIWQASALNPILFWTVLAGGLWWLLAIILVVNFPKSRCLWAKSRLFVAVFGLLVLVPAWAALMSLRSLHIDTQFYFGAWAVFFTFVLVWAADVGAYFAGKRFGKAKLMPEVSPGKTREGFIGGLLLAVLIMIGVAAYIPVPQDKLIGYFLVGIVTVVVSVFGDLNESMFKRCAGVKDSGTILPGHGGILDRIDSLTSALPVFTLGYLWLIH
ncbi:MAG: phosphatidate cytidylyltransferase [Idiomarina sp.]|nr:phosphatidate cytidylyltransferase [Idiomarina sp.]